MTVREASPAHRHTTNDNCVCVCVLFDFCSKKKTAGGRVKVVSFWQVDAGCNRRYLEMEINKKKYEFSEICSDSFETFPFVFQ